MLLAYILTLFYCKEINTFIQQGHIKLIKSGPREIKCYKAFVSNKKKSTVQFLIKNVKKKNCFKMQDLI